MHCTKRITGDLVWVGADDRRLALFEGVYSVPGGVSYNSYLLTDTKTVLFDAVDKAVAHKFFENLEFALAGRALDYIIIQHMEPDHSASLRDLLARYPDAIIVCNAKTLDFFRQFNDFDISSRVHAVKESDTLSTGRHELHFVMAPMVHWPEVMVTYDSTDKLLFSADAFGCFGALNGAMFADEVDFMRDYMDEARRYYANIVGKYGAQVQTLLGKASALDINMICPLHGFVWRKNITDLITKYALWSGYEPEAHGVMLAYASVYGNTENAAEILASRLRDRGIKVVMFDVSVTPASEIVSAAFKWSHLVFASMTYNAGVFVSMEALLDDLAAHNIQNRTVAVIENGSWAAASGKLIREKLHKCKNMNLIENTITIKSSLKTAQLSELEQMAEAIAATLPKPENAHTDAMLNIPYGLFALTVSDGEKNNGCIINTVMQITSRPNRISVAVNKTNLTRDMIIKAGEFDVHILTENTPFGIFEELGFRSGRDCEKNISRLSAYANAVISAKVSQAHDYGTHTLFIAEVTATETLSDAPSVTYQYYFNHIKPKPSPPAVGAKTKGYVCKICGYVYEGEVLPEDFICPLCKHGSVDFEKQ
jgi:flavorubredoxin/rubredoxin